MAAVMEGFTKTETKMLNVLADGKRHERDELCSCLPLGNGSVKSHLYNLRKKLEASGTTVICELYKGGIYYRWSAPPPPALISTFI